MSNQKAADLIAANLGQLVHPGDGQSPAVVVPLAGYRTAGMPPEMADMMNANAKLIGESIVYLLESNGMQIVATSEIDQVRAAFAQQPPATQPVKVSCQACTNMLFTFTMDNTTVTGSVNGPYFLQQMRNLNEACPHVAGATG
jgi:phage gp45-like